MIPHGMTAAQQLRLAVIEAAAHEMTDAEIVQIVTDILAVLRSALKPRLEVVE